MKKVVLISFADELKKISTFGGAVIAYIYGESIVANEKGFAIFAILGWWVIIQAIAHGIIFLSEGEE